MPNGRRPARRPVSAGLAPGRKSLKRSQNFYSDDQLGRVQGRPGEEENDIEFFRWSHLL